MLDPGPSFTTAPLAALQAEHDRLAAERGRPLWIGELDRCRLAQAVAILRASPVAPRPSRPERKRRPDPIRQSILRLLGEVSHYQLWATGEPISCADAQDLPRHAVESVGLSYAEILRRLRAEFPTCRATEGNLRWHCAMARRGLAQFRCDLPDRRMMSRITDHPPPPPPPRPTISSAAREMLRDQTVDIPTVVERLRAQFPGREVKRAYIRAIASEAGLLAGRPTLRHPQHAAREMAIELLRSGTMTRAEVARRCGLPYAVVQRLSKERGLQPRSGRGRNRLRHSVKRREPSSLTTSASVSSTCSAP